mmetsp:Transcript_13723/g.32315  ORF Transcript_13723/g.32315 Transcript_13723/m.32315 type:complete len:110 (+) Transcript_13723:224-553(+)
MWSASAEAGAGGVTTARMSLLQEIQNSRRRPPGSSGEEVESTLVTASTSQRDALFGHDKESLFLPSTRCLISSLEAKVATGHIKSMRPMDTWSKTFRESTLLVLHAGYC